VLAERTTVLVAEQGTVPLPCGRASCRATLGFISPSNHYFRRALTGDVIGAPAEMHLRCVLCKFVTDLRLTLRSAAL
jgi:hypothetical protein